MSLGILDWQALESKSSRRGSSSKSKRESLDYNITGKISSPATVLGQESKRKGCVSDASVARQLSMHLSDGPQPYSDSSHFESLSNLDHGCRFDPIVRKVDSEGRFSDFIPLIKGCHSCCQKVQQSIKQISHSCSEEIDQGGHNLLAKFLPRNRSTVISPVVHV
jgi:hypothetical protein